MTQTAKIISPIDGSVYAERPIAADDEVDAAVSSCPRRASRVEARRRSPSASASCLAFLDALLAMNDEIVTELAWQMGRPVRFGGEKGGVEERTRSMADLAEKALAPLHSAGEARLPPLHRPRAARHS